MKYLESENVLCYTLPPPSGKIDSTSDWVFNVGRQHVDPGQEYPQKGFPQRALFKDAGGRCLDQFQLVFITHGSGTFIDRGLEYTVQEGSVFLLRPGFWHTYAPDITTGWTEYFIGFNGDVFSKTIQQSIPQDNSVYLLSPKLRGIFPKALEYADLDNEDTQLVLQSLLFLVLSCIAYGQAASPNGGKRSARLIVRARAYMERNISKQISLQKMASELGVSYSAFNQFFKDQTSLSPVRYLGRMRLQRAKYKLLKTDLSIKVIAQECGFSSTEYFCGVFHKETGMTPSEFRSAGSKTM